MTWNFMKHVVHRILPVLLLITLSLSASPVSADEPAPEIGEPVSIGPDTLDPAATQENAPAYTGCYRVNAAAVNASFEERVVEIVNQRRAEAGLPPLKRSAELDSAARYHAKDMMDESYFAHNSMDLLNNVLVDACAWSTRIQTFYINREYLGENLAAGQTTPESMMEGLMASTSHRNNILNPNYREIGVGFMQLGGRYSRYWVQDFGSRSNIYPIVINREASSTSQPQVSLYIYGQNVWNEMRLRNNGNAWSAWQPFRSTVTWSIPTSAGMHTVSVELRRAGSTATVTSSDTILVRDLPFDMFLPFTRR